MGSYLMAAGKGAGWYFFMLMDISMGTLMPRQGKPLPAAQQALPLCFVLFGLYGSLRRSRPTG